MNFCYSDESGIGQEPIATMVGIVVDSGRMHVTKSDWVELLELLSRVIGRHIAELHTADFYSGNGVWRAIDGPERSMVITEIFKWLAERKHHVVYTSVLKSSYSTARAEGEIPEELDTIWRVLGFHLTLAIQKHSQPEPKNKGHTLFVFDNEEQEEGRFVDLVLSPNAPKDGLGDSP